MLCRLDRQVRGKVVRRAERHQTERTSRHATVYLPPRTGELGSYDDADSPLLRFFPRVTATGGIIQSCRMTRTLHFGLV